MENQINQQIVDIFPIVVGVTGFLFVLLLTIIGFFLKQKFSQQDKNTDEIDAIRQQSNTLETTMKGEKENQKRINEEIKDGVDHLNHAIDSLNNNLMKKIEQQDKALNAYRDRLIRLEERATIKDAINEKLLKVLTDLTTGSNEAA